MFVHVGHHAGHQSHQYVRRAHAALFGRTRCRHPEQGIAGIILLYPHFGQYVVDQLVDHVGGGGAIGSMARIGIGEQS